MVYQTNSGLEDDMTNFTNYRDHTGSHPEKFFKATLFQGNHQMIGLNCLEPGQVQAVHDHTDADKVYVIMEGIGHFTVGNEVRDAGQGGNRLGTSRRATRPRKSRE